MQRCRYCGQLNDDDVDQCIYCGEPLFIQVDHGNDLSRSEISHQYAAKVAQELLEDERRKQQQKQPNLFDELDDFAKELLKPEDSSSFNDNENKDDNIFFTDDDYEKIRQEHRNNDIYPDAQYEDNNIYTPQQRSDDEMSDIYDPYDQFMDEDEDEENYVDVYEVEEDTRHIIFEDEDEDITVEHDVLDELEDSYYDDDEEIQQYPQDFYEDEIEDDNIPDEESIDENADLEKLRHIEDTLKSKIKRNKKLENHYGVNIKDITLDLDNLTGSFHITGNVSLNKRTNKNAVKITVKCFNKDKKQIDEDSVIMAVRGLDHIFNVTLKPNLNDVAIIIIVPELINISQKQLKQLKENRPIKTVKSVKSPESTNIKQQQKRKYIKQPTKDDIKREYQKQKDDNDTKKESFKDKIIPHRKNKKKQLQYTDEKLVNNIYLEQIKGIERKVGMNIDNTSILIKNGKVEVVGEIHIKNPEKCQEIKIATTCYDKDNKIIATDTLKINTKMFLGFDTLHIVIDDVDINEIKRIRLYPTFL
ncbi:hypothetical protein [uncultured Methanosphaera sp.]|uniref:hypothetical protein n=1 Tax=uncultured Methanosphaera sp. TaxID=262501 RepID=UPI0028043311|nr:hypothetical protein [uncultured Methanosphaera sp.]